MSSCECGADLTTYRAISRKYVRSDDGDVNEVHGLGHYTQDGDWEPDESITLNGHDTHDGCDTCARCGRTVG